MSSSTLDVQALLEQLGGNRFRIMTGARNFVRSTSTLSFRLPTGLSPKKVNAVRITLEDSDTYTVDFLRIRGLDVSTVASCSDVYAEDLRKVFTSETGLYTSL